LLSIKNRIVLVNLNLLILFLNLELLTELLKNLQIRTVH